MPLSQQEKLLNYHQKTLFPLYQDIILTLQNDLRRSFQTYGVHENTLREFMVLWEKLLAAELGMRDGKDRGLGENEVDLLLDELDDILDDDAPVQVDGHYDVLPKVPQSTNTHSASDLVANEAPLQLDGQQDEVTATTTTITEIIDDDPDFDLETYRAPIDENEPQDILICQYSDIKFNSTPSEYEMDLVRGVLYLGNRDYLFHRGACKAKFERATKVTTVTPGGAVISNIGATARMQNAHNNDMNLNITELTKRLQNAEYDPQVFGGHHVQIRRDEPRSTCKIFRTGTINVIGASSVRDAKIAASRAAALVRASGVPDATIKNIRITSVSASYNYGREIDLSMIHAFYPQDFVHAGEDRTAIDYEMKHPPVKLKIYQTGSIKITDAKSEEAIDECIKLLVPHLDHIVQVKEQQEAAQRERERQEAEHRAFLLQQEMLARQQQLRQQQQQQQNQFGSDPSWYTNKDIDF